MPGSLTWEDLDGKLVGQGWWDGLCVMDFEIVTFWGKFWVRKGIMKWISIILFWTTVMIFGTWLWEYGLILVAPVDFEIITWFGFAWMPEPAGGEAGRTFKSRMCTLIILQWQVGFSKNNPDDSLFPCKWASQREKQVSFGPSSAGERAKHTWQLWLFCGDRLEPPAVELENELENN